MEQLKEIIELFKTQLEIAKTPSPYEESDEEENYRKGQVDTLQWVIKELELIKF